MSAIVITRPITTRPITNRPNIRPITTRAISVSGRSGPVRSVTPRRIPELAPDVTPATYRRRRAVVGTLLAVLVAASAVLTHDVLAGSGGVPASAAVSQPARTRATVTARPGDTLWSIAERHHPRLAGQLDGRSDDRSDDIVSLSRYVDALVDLNGGAAIQAGQAVILP